MAVVDPESPVLRFCERGTAAAREKRHADALALYHDAWRLVTNDAEACIAAHHIARAQSDAMTALWWNQIALGRGGRCDSQRVRELLPTLHLDIAIAYEQLNQLYAARHHYQAAAATLEAVRDPVQRDMIERGLERGLA